jgi:hypothetical protein
LGLVGSSRDQNTSSIGVWRAGACTSGGVQAGNISRELKTSKGHHAVPLQTLSRVDTWVPSSIVCSVKSISGTGFLCSTARSSWRSMLIEGATECRFYLLFAKNLREGWKPRLQLRWIWRGSGAAQPGDRVSYAPAGTANGTEDQNSPVRGQKNGSEVWSRESWGGEER